MRKSAPIEVVVHYPKTEEGCSPVIYSSYHRLLFSISRKRF